MANAFLAVAALASSLVSGSAVAASYYVSLGGNDGSNGSIGAPFRTINRGIAAANAGDTVYIRGGIYTEQAIITKSGAAGAPIRIQSYSGESVTIDGQNQLPGAWDALVYVGGSYVEVSGLEVKNSRNYGVHLDGPYGAARGMNIHHTWQHGLLLRGDNGVLEDNRVWQASLSNNQGSGGGMWASGIMAGRDSKNGITDNGVVRRNTVYNNWGEGIMSLEANGTLIEDNVSYDNYATNLYLCNTTNAIARRNLVYVTAGNPMGVSSYGISMADEYAQNPSSNISIVNNVIHGTATSFAWWSGYPNTYIKNLLFAHNTLVNIVGGVNNVNFNINNAPHQNVRIVNNIIQQDDAHAVVYIPSGTPGLSFANNLWSKKPSSNAASATDIVANPQLAKTGSTSAGQFDRGWFKLTSASPAVNRGTVVSTVTDDLFANLRDSTPDVGAHENGSSTTAPPPPTATPNGTNLALNKSAVASTVENGNYPAGKAFDGSTSTRWASQFSDPQWIYVDLGANYNVSGVKLVWEAASSKAYQLQVSLDATNWTTIYSTAAGTGGTQNLTGLAGVGRYVRMYGQSRNTVYGHSLWEMEVYGTAATTTGTVNLALNKTAVASSLENGSYPAGYAFDGNAATRWASQFSDPQWIYVDLGGKYNISRVKLLWETASSRSYQVQVSNDASTWTNIYSTTTGAGGTVDLTSVTGVGRYVRILGTSRNTVWGHSLWEVEVYGTPAP